VGPVEPRSEAAHDRLQAGGFAIAHPDGLADDGEARGGGAVGAPAHDHAGGRRRGCREAGNHEGNEPGAEQHEGAGRDHHGGKPAHTDDERYVEAPHESPSPVGPPQARAATLGGEWLTKSILGRPAVRDW